MSGGKGGGYRRCFEAFSDDIVANLSSSKTYYAGCIIKVAKTQLVFY